MLALGYDEQGNPPSSFVYYGVPMQVGKFYKLDGGDTRNRGRTVEVLNLSPLGCKAQVKLANGETTMVRMASIGPEVVVNTESANGANGASEASKLVETSVLASLASKLPK
jgi:hypothetical protein